VAALDHLDSRRKVGRIATWSGEAVVGREQFIESPDAAGAYLLRVENEGPGLESISVSAELTSEVAVPPTPAPSPTGRPPAEPTPRRSGEPG
jgi:hypothetical protein